MDEEDTKTGRCWAIVELFGHTKIAGEISEQTMYGGTFCRIDVPGADGEAGFTRFYGPSAIYSITPVSEEIAGLAARSLSVRPVTIWIPQTQLALPEAETEDDEHIEPRWD